MNTDILRSFVEVARQGSYTKAARNLFLSQPTVYQHVRVVEQMLGADLVRQVGKRVVLTPEGKVAIDQAVRVLDEVTHLTSTVLLDHHELRKGQLDLIVGTSFGQSVFPLGLGHFRNRYPGISVRVDVQPNPDDIDDLLARFGYDGAFHGGDRSRTGIERELLVSDRLVLAVPLGHQLAGRRFVTAHDIREFGIICYVKPFPLRLRIDEWATSQSVVIPTTLELNSQVAVATAVAAGAGIAVLDAVVLLPFVRAGMVQAVSLDPPTTRPWYFAHRSDVPVPLALEKLVEMLRSAFDTTDKELVRLLGFPR